MTNAKDAELSYGEKKLTLEHIDSTEGNGAFNAAGLLKETGRVAYDPGFMNTANAKSAITYIDGDEGILRYRGYPIDELAEKSNFVETAYLLIYGNLPSASEYEEFETMIRRHTMVHEDFKTFFDGFPRDAHPMAVLAASVSAMSTFYSDSLDPFDDRQVEISTFRLLSKVPTLAAYAFKKSKGEPFMYPQNKLNYAENLLQMCFGFPTEEYEVDPVMAKALDTLLLLHADHEQNCSASTVRLVGSAHANIFTSISAGINALYGPLHGGANEAVLNMLRKIQAEGIEPEQFMEKVKNKEDGIRLMGFGHRVYKNYDPRARIIKKTADEVLEQMGGNNELLDIARRLEEKALADDYFIERKLYPNVDFYTGMIYKAMGFPEEMFTVLFALGRMPGWIAQWREMIQDPETKIGRPRQVYIGEGLRHYPGAK
ncbi:MULTISPECIES: citrate synthase [Rothia]|uniref:citrate synthase n=1 Tax=Rothia TaxID=32207 RepID=UPI00082BDB16|nr:citrate synthase [Rothia sp. ND6WE1A]SIJ75236.1 citrate synthase I, hexameric type [Mycobacteroides abscessus subsp. abscessus]